MVESEKKAPHSLLYVVIILAIIFGIIYFTSGNNVQPEEGGEAQESVVSP
ncbi:MAG: hypothetical protein NUV53_02785 [Patescibacteria group bacterium]|nr:hypothetical protein [Patescibacteria group bacterium]